MKTETLGNTPTDLDKAARLLSRGDLVAFPTETVYGLGADARNGRAVAAIYEAKGRPSFNPLIVHVADVAAAQALTVWSDDAQTLADAFWPGPLTLVLPLVDGSGVSELVSAGLPSVAVRVPAHPTARALLDVFAGPIAAPSANPSGQISPTTAAHVLSGLDGRIAAVVDAGACDVGLESTIVGLAHGPAQLLRAGGLDHDALEQTLGAKLQAHGDGITAPGQIASHYAPNAAVRLDADAARDGEVLLGFGPVNGTLNLSETANLTEAAANLFGHLHKLNALNKPIAVARIPNVGLGVAINDRLKRAAAPR
jgi:L-threonylcarbamoyladenylate synthase